MVDKELADKITETAVKMLRTSQDFKKPRMERLKEYEDLYAGKIQPRLRMQFNVPLPVFSGLVNTLEADYYDRIKVVGSASHPADYKGIKKINAAWDMEVASQDVNSEWDLKNRWDIHLGIMTGLGIKKYYAESDPKYKSHLDITHLAYFHFEPRGGGQLEKHLFCGEEAIFKTKQQLIAGMQSGLYDREQCRKFFSKSQSNEYKNLAEEEQNKQFARFQALNLDVESNNYVGQELFNLCEFNLTYKGKRYYLLFDPLLREWVRCERLKDVFSEELYEWDVWHTHEDPLNMLTKSYTDDFFPVAMSIIEFLSQEMTNRSKRNLGAKLYDRSAIYDVAKLDAAQYRPDALVPVNTKNGTVKLSETVHMLETPEIKNTLDMIGWLEGAVARETGVTDLDQKQLGKKAAVAFAFLQQAQKRISHKSAGRVESWGKIYRRFIQGLRDHLSGAGMAIQMLGSDGFSWWDELTRADLTLAGKYSVKVLSTTEQDKENVLGKDQKSKAMELIIGNPNLLKEVNPKVAVEFISHDMGGFDDESTTRLMDIKDYGNKDLMSDADLAISQLIKGQWPDKCYAATTAWASKILRFERDHQVKLEGKQGTAPDGSKVPLSIFMIKFVESHTDIIKQNMDSLAQSKNTASAAAAPQDGAGADPGNGGAPAPAPNQNPVSRQSNVPQVAVKAGAS